MLCRIHNDHVIDSYESARIYKKAFESRWGIKKLLDDAVVELQPLKNMLKF